MRLLARCNNTGLDAKVPGRAENHWDATISRRRRYESYNTTRARGREGEMVGTDPV